MKNCSFKAKMWKHKGGWHFITIPKLLSKKIRKVQRLNEEGWGRLKATAKIGTTKWETSIWFDLKYEAYLLPVKSDLRKKEKLETGKILTVSLILNEVDKRYMSWIMKK